MWSLALFSSDSKYLLILVASVKSFLAGQLSSVKIEIMISFFVMTINNLQLHIIHV